MAQVLVANHGIIPPEKDEEQYYVGLSNIWDYKAVIELGVNITHTNPVSQRDAEALCARITKCASELKRLETK